MPQTRSVELTQAMRWRNARLSNQPTNVAEKVEGEEGAEAGQGEDNAAKGETVAKPHLRVALICLAILAAVPMAILARRKFKRV